MSITVHDNFLGNEKREEVLNFISNLKYVLGEQDREDTPPTGEVCELVSKDLDIPNFIEEKFNRSLGLVSRFYVNKFEPQELPYWHDDGECTTYLYYPCDVNNLDEGGETQFLLDNKILAVPYAPDRLVEFNGRIPHCAKSFRSQTRYTIAIKYRDIPWS